MNLYLGTGIALVGYLVLAWFTGNLLGLSGRDLWVLRIGLMLIGLIGAAIFLWFRTRREAAAQAADQPAGAEPGGDEIDALFREAESRLQAAKLGRAARIGNLPVILVMGEGGCAKTSTILHSGIEPELLAGQIYQDNAILPTRAVNLWFAKQSVFVEAGGRLVAEPGRWSRLVRRLQPGKLAAVGKSEQAPRAAIVCFDCENLVRGSEAASASARNLQARLGEISQQLGIRLPVYVLFTKMDRVAFFTDYVGNLGNDEATQPLGVTLPIRDGGGAGVWAEQETQRLSQAVDELFYSLAEKRLDFLPREHDAGKLPGIYEFPREFRKLRAAIVQFLVDLCRPSQLRANPFLRGFYFSGARPVVISEMAPEQPVRPVPQQPSSAGVSGATGMFRGAMAPPPAAQPYAQPQVVGSRRVPQWVFLTHLFNNIVLQDRSALGASGASARTSLARRILLAVASALCLLLALTFIVSYVRNAALENRVLDAVRGIAAAEAGAGALPSADGLRRLESLRQSLEELTRYEREGAPLSYRWGLYAGSDLYPDVRRAYFSRFHQLLFASTQAALLRHLQGLPAAPGPGDDYGATYDTLKAYLITTSHHDKSTRLFLSPVLLKHWAAGRGVDAERLDLAQRQFDFYAEELKVANPFSPENDTLAIERARRFLAQFAGIERVYQFMLAEASKKAPSINFNRQFPGSAEVLINNREVAGAYSKAGWTFMQNAMKNADRFFAGEAWVLGPQSGADVDRAKLEQELRARYYADFINQWRIYLRSGVVVKYANVPDAAKKLLKLSGNQSPLLAMLCLASQNTAVDAPEVARAFQPVQQAVPPACQDQYIAPTNANYVNALVALQASFDQMANAPPEMKDAAKTQSFSNATNAKAATRQIAQNFKIDQEGQIHATVQKLMEDPISWAEALLRGMGPAELNARGAGLCAQWRALMQKYPFSPSASQQATLAEVAAVFQPGAGALWSFHDASLKPYLVRQGNEYMPKPEGGIRLTPGFVAYFNRAAQFGEALYPGGAQQPRLSYALTAYPVELMQSLTLTMDGQTLTSGGGRTGTQQFTWPGAVAQGMRLSGKTADGTEVDFYAYEGLWAAFRWFADADRFEPAGAAYSLAWTPTVGQSRQPLRVKGQPVTFRFGLDMKGAPPFFRKGYFQGLGCVSQVAQ